MIEENLDREGVGKKLEQLESKAEALRGIERLILEMSTDSRVEMVYLGAPENGDMVNVRVRSHEVTDEMVELMDIISFTSEMQYNYEEEVYKIDESMRIF